MRKPNQLRKIEIVRDFTKYAAGSVLIKWGDTWVLCTASVSDKVPPFLKDGGKGWVTAEYSMLPSCTPDRKDRDIKKLKLDARSTEIQRLIGRALRAAVDMEKLGERMITVDCDVLQADGGTRCASITGGMVALELAVKRLLKEKVIAENPIVRRVAAVSVGVCDGTPTLDLDYIHDSTAEVDLNVIMTDKGQFVELQGCAEHKPFTDRHLAEMIALAKAGLKRIFGCMKKVSVFALLLGLAATVSAGESGWSVGASGELTLPAGGSRLHRVGGAALRVGYEVSENVAVEGEAAWLEDFVSLSAQGLWHVRGASLYDYYFGYSRFDPFITFGAHGWLGRHGVGQVGPKAGLGAFYHLTNDWALRFDADCALGLETRREVDFTLAAGVQYSF